MVQAAEQQQNNTIADPADPEAFRILPAGQCAFELTMPGRLSLTVSNQRSYPRVKLRRLFPIRHPHLFISVMDETDNEIGIVEDLSKLDSASRKRVEHELDIFYAVPEIREIEDIRAEYGFYHWQTITDRGPRSFWVKGRTENITSPETDRLFVTDIEKCRYEIPDTNVLSRTSQRFLSQVL